MRTKDWKAINTPQILVVGEDSNLQWSETVAKYAMFADYYFRNFPEDHGERSRNVESRNLFDYIMELTGHQLTPEDVYMFRALLQYKENEQAFGLGITNKIDTRMSQYKKKSEK